MSARRAGLRLRLFASLLGAVLLAGALLAVPLLLAVRDTLYTRRLAELRKEADLYAHQVQLVCGYAVSPSCAAGFAQLFDAKVLLPGRCVPQLGAKTAVVCRELPGGQAVLAIERGFGEVQGDLVALDAKLLGLLGAGLLALFALIAWLLERAVVRRLRGVEAELARVAAGDGKPELVPEGGDAVSNLEVSVRQLGLQLHEERGRTAARITELQGSNRDLRQARAELARSERLASVGRLAAGVAHEVGNPVSAVIGYAALLKERLAQGKGDDGYVERIEREAGRIDRILRDLLDLARPPPAQPAAAVLARVVAAARAAVLPQQAFSGVAIEVDLPAALPPVRGEEHFLVQVFVNLFANAVRAGAHRLCISARVDAGCVVAQVKDDGRGIAPTDLPRLFEPFFTTAAPGEGTGLGLALCHATMERFGGSISAVQPADGRGALFELTFAAGQGDGGR